jgi:soluble lytic murein transglycosylase
MAWRHVLPVVLLSLVLPVRAVAGADAGLEAFRSAWAAAATGDHEEFRRIKAGLGDYLLYPYLQYEDYRHRRHEVPAGEMSQFIETHNDWAFSTGLKMAWLRSLAKHKRWNELVRYSGGVTDTRLRCQRAHAQVILKQTDGLMSEAQSLWLAGKSQPDECDPVFSWLRKNDGITEALAWQRILLAMARDNRQLVSYLARYVPEDQRRWLDDWNWLSRKGYSGMSAMRRWPDNPVTRMIAGTSLRRLARNKAEVAAEQLDRISGHFSWSTDTLAELQRETALYAAVDLNDKTAELMQRVPVAHRDSQLLEWWARYLLSRQDWKGLVELIGQFPDDIRFDERWRYWLAQAETRSGAVGTVSNLLRDLANEATYYGFLAADELNLAYNICPLEANIPADEIDRLAGTPGFRRALELRRAQLDRWATEEWSMAVRRLPASELRVAAGLAQREDWTDRVIFALGNSGDLQFYDWRFPLKWLEDVQRVSAANRLDPAWVYGTMRSESAMLVTARSSANAIGLMQVTPATGKRVARKHGLAWSGVAQLSSIQGNLPIGTAYMRELLDDFDQNPVLVSGAYNAGPNAVNRWLKTRPREEAAIWIETLPYFETRDYIPRVLAFTTIYDWRLDGETQRISMRMPHIESGKIGVTGSAVVACQVPDDAMTAGK